MATEDIGLDEILGSQTDFLDDQINAFNLAYTGRKDYQPPRLRERTEDGTIVMISFEASTWELAAKFVLMGA